MANENPKSGSARSIGAMTGDLNKASVTGGVVEKGDRPLNEGTQTSTGMPAPSTDPNPDNRVVEQGKDPVTAPFTSATEKTQATAPNAEASVQSPKKRELTEAERDELSKRPPQFGGQPRGYEDREHPQHPANAKGRGGKK